MGGLVQGTYDVKNKKKYIGAKNPRYLSSWELKVFQYLDENPQVVKWGSEVVIVPYFSKIENKMRRYLVDVYVEFVDNHGKRKKELIEIKPDCQTRRPKRTKRKKEETFLRENYTFSVNHDKWIAASKYAKKRNMKFRIMTEKRDIYL